MATNTVSKFAFSPTAVKYLSDDDFDFTDKSGFYLKSLTSCCLVLFFIKNTESFQLGTVYAAAAEEIAGVTLAAINVAENKRTAQALMGLHDTPSSPISWIASKGYPFILVFRGGWPTAGYNGARETQALINYTMALACKADYHEHILLGAGVQTDTRLGIGGYNPYVNTKEKPDSVLVDSGQFTAQTNIRGYDSSKGIEQLANSTETTGTSESNPSTSTTGSSNISQPTSQSSIPTVDNT